jgi:hypothetical protein
MRMCMRMCMLICLGRPAHSHGPQAAPEYGGGIMFLGDKHHCRASLINDRRAWVNDPSLWGSRSSDCPRAGTRQCTCDRCACERALCAAGAWPRVPSCAHRAACVSGARKRASPVCACACGACVRACTQVRGRRRLGARCKRGVPAPAVPRQRRRLPAVHWRGRHRRHRGRCGAQRVRNASRVSSACGCARAATWRCGWRWLANPPCTSHDCRTTHTPPNTHTHARTRTRARATTSGDEVLAAYETVDSTFFHVVQQNTLQHAYTENQGASIQVCACA